MKRPDGLFRTVVVAVMTVALQLFSACARNVLPSLSGREDVERVYISPAIMKMAGAGDLSQYGAEAAQFLKEVKSVCVYNCTTGESMEIGRKAVEEYLREHPEYEELITAEEGQEKSEIYGVVSDKDDGRCDRMLVIAGEDGELAIVFINPE